MDDRFKRLIKGFKVISLIGGCAVLITYHIRQTCRSLDKIINLNVLDAEKKYTPEYIYIDDPKFDLKMVQSTETRQSVGLSRIWKSLRDSLASRLLWLCRHGNQEQRDLALQHLASFKNNKKWECLKLAQALDMNTAVLLARTRGADLRYFLPPPIHVRRAALSSELMSFKLRDMIVGVQRISPHSCIKYFLSKYFANLQEQAMEADNIPAKPDVISERELCMLCLDALYHHIILFHSKNYIDDKSTSTLINMDLLPRLAELFLRYRNDVDMDVCILKILTVISMHTVLLKDFFQNGLIGELCRLIKSEDVRLSSSAAVCLANLSGEHCFRPGLYLLHPLYRTRTKPMCDTLLIHGLRGGVFVTWRQRDPKCDGPLVITDVKSKVKCGKPCVEEEVGVNYMDPELKQVLDDLTEMDEESLLSNMEIVLQDIPIEAKRDSTVNSFTAAKKRIALIRENEDNCTYTHCWPKDWLPKDCKNLRILGVNYWSSLSEWLEGCPLQSADIPTRAVELIPALIDARVGQRNVPIIWLAHSMGGLIVKQLLIEAAESQDDLQKICEQTKAVLFYSTPHRGTSLASLPRAADAVLWPSHDVKQLKENSPILLNIQNKFLTVADKYDFETISFAESMPTLVTAFKVPMHFVAANSADLGRGVFYQLPLDHLTICKPASRQSILYTTVIDVIQRTTHKKCELQYPNIFLEKFYKLFSWRTLFKATGVIDSIEDTQYKERFRWFERIILDTYTGSCSD
ncbi:Protein SERAC1 [Papilio machaon]|uniref:Protein SERAC1 n=2 Tax=Papilio machaon TaxID=76193 RepID=A0A194QU20_PAPMA|nr:Protein SERAC1 [Papilio machaon]